MTPTTITSPLARPDLTPMDRQVLGMVYGFMSQLDTPFSAPMPYAGLRFIFTEWPEQLEAGLAHLEELGCIERPADVLGARDVALTVAGCVWLLTEGKS